MVELLYLSVLDDGARFEFVSLDTLTHPLDFLQSIEDLREDHQRIAEDEGINRTEVFGCFGAADEVKAFEDDILDEAYSFRMHPEIRYESSGEDESFIQSACAHILRTQSSESMAASYHHIDEESSFALMLLAASASFPSGGHCRVALEEFADAWLQQECPDLVGHQALTLGLTLNGVSGKRIIAPHFDPSLHQWELLLSGARRLALQGKPLYLGEQSDSSLVGAWTEPDIDSILLNPAYGFGVLFSSFEVIEDWLKALLYQCALSCYAQEWTEHDACVAYHALLSELKSRFPYEHVPPLMEEEEFIATFLELARRRAKALRGIEESVLTSRFAAEMPSRAYQLKVVSRLVRSALPEIPGLSTSGVAFDVDHYRELLRMCNASAGHAKGMALEDLAAYLLNDLSGWMLAGRRVRADDCEIDLCYVNASLRQKDWDMGCMLLVECKNRSNVAGVSVLRNLAFVMDAKGARSGIIISTSGFTKVVKEQVSRLAMQGRIIILLDGDDLAAIADGLSPEECIFNKKDALMEGVEDDFGLFC